MHETHSASKQIIGSMQSLYRFEQFCSGLFDTSSMSKRQADSITLPQLSDDDRMVMDAPSKKRCVHEDASMPVPSGDKRRCQLQQGHHLTDGSSSSSFTSTGVHSMGESSQSPLHLSQTLDDNQGSKHQECGDSSNITSLGSMASFPAILHSILRRTDLKDMVGWMPDGKSWRVFRPREFEIKVLPNYFNHGKYSSFLRQAHAWGFRSGEPDPQLADKYHSYYHELFLRDAPYVIKIMELQQQQRRCFNTSENNHLA